MELNPGLGELEEQELEELLLLIADMGAGFKEKALYNILRKDLDSIYPFIERALRDDNQADLRNGAMEVLVAFGGDSVPRLVKLLKDDNEEIRIFSAVMLGRIRHSEAVEPLISMLQDPDINVRHSAAEALGEIGDQRAVLPLQEFFRHGVWLLYPAIHALGMLGEGKVAPLLREMLPSEILTELVQERP